MKILIFDCDGVLLDTERLLNQVFSECLADIGLCLTVDEAIEHFKGISTKDCFTKLKDQWGLIPPKSFEDDYEKRAINRYNTHLEIIPYIDVVLDELAGYSKCVASGSNFGRVRHGLHQKHLVHHFGDSIFTSTQVKKGKPAPDLFLFAAEQMNADYKNCIVVEDSVPGVQAAVAANMFVLGYADITPEDELQKAGAITFRDMRELPRLIKSF
jgi:phosphoglycolate phosphatase